MYVLNVSYTQSPETVAPYIPSHGLWVEKYIENGTFLLAGPKKSGLGGVVLVKSIPRAELKALLAADSYVQADVVEYQIVDITPKLVAAHFDNLLSL